MANVYWLIAAQREFNQAMPPGMLPQEFCAIYRELCQILCATFPDAPAIIVRNRLHGYRNPPDKHILLVELIHRVRPCVEGCPGEPAPIVAPDALQAGCPDFCRPEETTQTTAHVVKIAVRKDLRKELDAWRNTRPTGMAHDAVLMRLRGGWDAAGASDPVSLIYEDANHVIGVGTVRDLESAVLDCVQWGIPTENSLTLVLKCLFGRLGEDFYVRSKVSASPEEAFKKLRDWKKFDRWLKDWQDDLTATTQPQLDRLRIRREALGFLARRRDEFIDPVDYLRSVSECSSACPLLLRGTSHGDLHGHNVLVSVIDGDATLPAVFDYEKMSTDNVVGWDFVKLETELKVRALTRIFGGPEPGFIKNVLNFERYLADRSQAMHDQQANHKDFDSPAGDRGRRLASLILTIRDQARRHLGERRDRDRQWLEEYYFLLACYGVCAGLYSNYQGYRRQIIAAYISAGVAARLLDNPWKHLDENVRASESTAQRQRKAQPPNPDPPAEVSKRPDGEMSHRERLAFVHDWLSVPKDDQYRPFVAAAKDLLIQLRRDYPHVLEIEEELALAMLELELDEEAEKLLRQVSLRYTQMSDEMLCRFGRLWKNRGDRAESSQTRPLEAPGHFQEALRWYERAYNLANGYYPGINLATLHFVLGQRHSAQQVLAAVTGPLMQGQHPAAERPWINATLAEAAVLQAGLGDPQLLRAKCEESERLYRDAAGSSSPRDKEAMKRQLRLILRHGDQALRDFWDDDKLNDVFGP